MQSDNKRIVKNTVVNYLGLLANTVLGIFISRYILLALGASDYGLYGVVGGLIAMLNVLSTAMTTTTRRFVNVEMGKPDGNSNMIFNVCLMIHVILAILVLLIAETIGLYYIYNYLNVNPDRFNDAVWVFHVSTVAAVIGITNVPFQALVEAFERFDISIGVNIFCTVMKLVFAVYLLSFSGNTLRVFAIGMSCLAIVQFVIFRYVCIRKWYDVVRFKIYKRKSLYGEILFFNNYIAIGALASVGRTQGSMMIINYFFGTIVNAAFQIAYSIERYCSVFVNNIGRAAWPQITQSYLNKRERTIELTECMSRYTILLTLLITTPLFAELDFILKVWLKNVPEGTYILCNLTLLDAIVKSICGGTSALVQASGKIKWFQIVDSGISILTLPVAFIAFKFGCPKETILFLYILSSLVVRIVSFLLLKALIGFDVLHYIKNVYFRPIVIIVISLIYLVMYHKYEYRIDSLYDHLFGFMLTFFFVSVIIIFWGLTKKEKTTILNNMIKL